MHCMGTQLQESAHLVCHSALAVLPARSNCSQLRSRSSALHCQRHSTAAAPVVSSDKHYGLLTSHSHHLLGPWQSKQRCVGEDEYNMKRCTSLNKCTRRAPLDMFNTKLLVHTIGTVKSDL